MSLFITFEGGEGSGKGVQSRRLYRQLLRAGVPVLLTHEPGGTPLGEAVSRWLKWPSETRLSVETELMLFNASRSYLVSSVIRPGLDQGQVVICDRFTDSTVAYQGYGQGLDLQLIAAVNHIATGGLIPDITFLLDIPPAAGLARKNPEKADRFEKESIAFHDRVRRGYLAMAHAAPARWYIVNGSGLKATIAAIIWEKVNRVIGCRGN